MITKRTFVRLLVPAIYLLAAACTGNNAPDRPAAESAVGYDQLLPALQSAGFAVEAAGGVTQPFFEPQGKVIKVGDQDIQVFEFGTESEAALAAGGISPDGSSVGTSMISWIAPPHFYQSGKLIVLYLGDEEGVIKSLEEILGAQVAGR